MTRMTGNLDEQILRRLAAETGRILGELGVRADDDRWIDRQAQILASLGACEKRRGALARFFYRLARSAARIAR